VAGFLADVLHGLMYAPDPLLESVSNTHDYWLISLVRDAYWRTLNQVSSPSLK
jgi:hypothetical protein